MGLYGNDVYLWIIENNGMKNTYPPYIIFVGEYLRRIKKNDSVSVFGVFPQFSILRLMDSVIRVVQQLTS